MVGLAEDKEIYLGSLYQKLYNRPMAIDIASLLNASEILRSDVLTNITIGAYN